MPVPNREHGLIGEAGRKVRDCRIDTGDNRAILVLNCVGERKVRSRGNDERVPVSNQNRPRDYLPPAPRVRIGSRYVKLNPNLYILVDRKRVEGTERHWLRAASNVLLKTTIDLPKYVRRLAILGTPFTEY